MVGNPLRVRDTLPMNRGAEPIEESLVLDWEETACD